MLPNITRRRWNNVVLITSDIHIWASFWISVACFRCSLVNQFLLLEPSCELVRKKRGVWSFFVNATGLKLTTPLHIQSVVKSKGHYSLHRCSYFLNFIFKGMLLRCDTSNCLPTQAITQKATSNQTRISFHLLRGFYRVPNHNITRLRGIDTFARYW